MDVTTLAVCKKMIENGGGSGLPTPTASDIGKVATVVGETSKGAVIVPEQDAFVGDDNPATLSNANVLLFTKGANVIVTVSQFVSDSEVIVERTATVDNNYSVTVILPDGHTTLEIYENSGGLDCITNGLGQGTSTILSMAVNLVNVDVSWGMGGGSGGGVLLVNEVFDPQTKTTSLDKTWQEIRDAAPLAYLVEPDPDADDGASYYALTQIGKITGTGCFVTFGANYGCANPSDYPVFDWQP